MVVVGLSSAKIISSLLPIASQIGAQISVRAGSVQYNSGGQLIKVSKITQHPEYNASTIQNDIAILQLNHRLEFGPKISAVELPSPEEPAPETGAKCSISGWGTTSAGASSQPSTLLATTVNIVDHDKCVNEYADNRRVTDSMICAGVLGGGKDACQGDSGGPLVEKSSKKQVGIVSWGKGCASARYHGVYTSTVAYWAWIRENTLL
jgi:trypsin